MEASVQINGEQLGGDNELADHINALVSAMIGSYVKWQGNYNVGTTENNARLVEQFRTSFSFDVGKKYVRIVGDGSNRGFIVRQDDGMFHRGDMLKAASWSQPAKNFARGTVFNENNVQRVYWTGIA